jgi:hypothetical protein
MNLRKTVSRTDLHRGPPRELAQRPERDVEPGDTIAIGRRTLRVLGVRDDDADQPPALVVEDLPGSATGVTG